MFRLPFTGGGRAADSPHDDGGPARVRVHAVKRAIPREGGDAGGWYMVEMTVAPPATLEDGWSPRGLLLLDLASPSHEDAVGIIHDARVWLDESWHAVAGPLAGTNRLRLLYHVQAGAPQVMGFWLDGPAIGELDLARCPAPGEGGLHGPAGDGGVGRAGECAGCGTLTLLDAQDLCQACRGLGSCVAHADVRAAARCLQCRQPYCADCLVSGRCEACAAAPAPTRRRRGGPAPAGPEAAPKGERKPVDRRLVLAGVLLLLGLVVGGQYAWSLYEDAAIVATEDQVYKQRYGLVLGGVSAFRQEKQRLPKDPAELTAYMKAKGGEVPRIAGAGGKPAPEIVVYVPKDGDFDLYVGTNDGGRYPPEGTARPD